MCHSIQLKNRKKNLQFGACSDLTIILLIIFFIGTAYSFENIEVIESDQTSLILELKAFEISFHEVIINGSRFQKIESSDQFALLTRVGFPQVPIMGVLLGIPFSSSPTVRVLEAQYEEIPNILLCPAPQIRFQNNDFGGYLSEEYNRDKKIYSLNKFLPTSLAEIISSQTFRSQKLAKLELHPVQYNPKTKVLRRYRNLKIEVIYHANKIHQTIKNFPHQHDVFNSLYQKILVNYSIAQNWQNKIQLSEIERLRHQNDWYNPAYPYYKLLVSQDGIYHLSYNELLNYSIPINTIDPRTIKIYRLGQEVPIFVSGEDDGIFQPQDFIEFYGKQNYGKTTYFDDFTNTNVYWLTFGGDSGQRITEKTTISGDFPELSSFQKKLHLERDLSYYHGDEGSTVINTKLVAGEGWVWALFYKNDQKNFPLNLENVELESSSLCSLKVKLRGITLDQISPDHHAVFSLNESPLGEVYFDNREEIVYNPTFKSSLLKDGINNFVIKSEDTGAEINSFYFDWLELSYRASTQFINNKLKFRVENDQNTRLSLWNFCSDTIGIYNLTRNYRVSQYEVSNEQRFIFKVISAGFDDGNIAYIRINADYAIYRGHRGHNIAVFDTTGGQLEDSRWFDTLEATENSDSMAAYISRIPEGRIVLVAIRDEGTYRMTEAAYQALESLGSGLTRQVGFRDSWALIGRKGAAPGSVPEILVTQGNGMATVTDTLFTHHNYSKHIVFQDQLKQGDEFFLVAIDSMRQPDQIISDQYRNLRDIQIGADYIFITHEKFRQCAEQFAQFWAERNYRTIVVDIQDIYDEFNFGIKHPKAIKDFLSFAYHNWTEPAPSFVLLIGDASWDPKKNSPASTKEDFIPTFGNPVSDNWLVCFDGQDDLLPEMFIGRLAIESNQQGERILEKVKLYESLPPAEWVKNILFINGGFNDMEQAIFGNQTNRIINNYVIVPPSSCVAQVISKELDGLYEGEKREQIMQAINDGKLWVNFIGHGGSGTWELMFHDEQVFQLQNGDRLPFVTSFTCHTGRFANPETTNFGENFVNIPEAGAIGFMGTTGWGFIYEDEQFADRLFETVLKDTVHQFGMAIALAKIKLWGSLYHNVITQSIIYQYSLLGDPAVNLALPEQPDLAIKENSMTWTPHSPVEDDSMITLHLQVKNYGLATSESVQLKVSDNFQLTGTSEIFNGMIVPLGFIDSVTVPWSVNNKAGQHLLEYVVDPDDAIAEADETNNQATFSLNIGSSRITISMPANEQIVTEKHPRLQVNNPVSTKTGVNYYFEIDTTMSFNSDLLIQSESIPAGAIVTSWIPPTLQNKTIYYWRCRNFQDGIAGNWLTSSFLIDEHFGWAQKKYDQFKDNIFINTELTSAGIQLLHKEKIFHVESSGFDDLNSTVIFINSSTVANAKRGHNIAVCDIYGNFIEFQNFDTHGSAEDVAAMVNFLSGIPTGYYVLIGIRDSGAQAMTEEAYQALESIGSQYCREVGYRDGWAIIGKQGAPLGSVPEQLVKRFNGVAIVEDTLITYDRKGEIISPVIGPSNSWKKLVWNADCSSAGTATSIDVLAFNKSSSRWDTLLTSLTNNTGESLTAINSDNYSLLKLRANLYDDDGFDTPLLQNWSVLFDPVSDVAIGDRVVQFSADTVMEGELIDIEAKIYNVGYVPVDSLRIDFLYLDPDTGKTLFGEQRLLNLTANSWRTIKQTWNTTGHAGRNQIFIELDPDDQVNELTQTNNYYSRQLVVLADTTKPEIVVTYDGKQIADGAYVSKQPNINISIHDDSPLSIENDTTKINLFLNENRINYSGSENILTFMSLNGSQDSTLKAQLRLTPQLRDGDYTLEIFVKDASDNLAYLRNEFKVVTELRIFNVMNYPNPFRDNTYFTYFLTQPADEVTIKIYTVAGRLIRKIEHVSGEAGFNNVFWDGLDQDYDELANGVYLYKIIATAGDEQVECIEKLVVMR